MLLKTWRFVTVVLAALTMAMAFAHLMEMPARMGWDQTLWVGSTVTGGLYKMFGSVGAFINVAALVGLSGLVFLVRKRSALTFRLTLAAALLYIAGIAAWWAFVFPVNQELATWLTQPVPADWADWRRQWETTCAERSAGNRRLLRFASLDRGRDALRSARRRPSAGLLVQIAVCKRA
jgi:hypothetical protein